MTVDIPDWVMRTFAFLGFIGVLASGFALTVVWLNDTMKKRKEGHR